MTIFYDLLFWWNSCLINCTTLMTDNVNNISGDKNLIKGSRRAYTMSLVVLNSMWITLYTILDPEESCKTNLVYRGKSRMNVHYKTRNVYLVTSLPIHLKGRMTCCANYHFNEVQLLFSIYYVIFLHICSDGFVVFQLKFWDNKIL